MSRISSTGITTSAGLISGIPIEETVDQLIALSARPRNTLATRNQGLSAERAAVDQLASLTLGVQLSLSGLRSATTFSARTATSSNSAAVVASVASDATPAAGSYRFTPIRVASPHQLVSGQIDDIASLGSGSLSFGFGGHVDQGVNLDALSSTFVDGKIKITDRDGATATIDLRGAQTIDDVLQAINASDTIDVTATAEGDRLVLTDNSGGDGTLRVREVSGGSTAESLGLLGSAAGDTLTGEDIYGLSADSLLSDLNDGLGVRRNGDTTSDLRITLADGSTADVDLSGAETLGDVIDAINSAEGLGGALTAAINADGDGLVLTDTTSGDTLRVAEINGGSAATDLGIATDGTTGVLEGERLISGLKDTLVSTLGAGSGIELGELSVTDRAGVAATIDLTGAETLGEVIDRINASGAEVVASINPARNGITLRDDSGGSGALIVANGASGTTADNLGLAINAATDSINSGSLQRQTAGEATLLAEFNGGQGVTLGRFRIEDSAGRGATIRLEASSEGAGDEAKTLGDVIDRINASGLRVEARINDTGDGILLTDTAGGAGSLSVSEVSGGTTAAEIGLLGASTGVDENGRQVLDGSTRTTIEFGDLTNSPTSVGLASLNGSDGVDIGVFRIAPADGRASFAVDLGVNGNQAQTIGDVIDRINSAQGNNGAVTASVNEDQTGILLTDNTGGDGLLNVTEVGSGTAAADLRLVRADNDTNGGELNGAGLFTFDGDDALQTLADRINDAAAGVTASVFSDGDAYRLSVVTDNSGSNNELLIDAGNAFAFTETGRPGDGVGVVGGVGGVGGFAVASSDNRFNDVVDGVDLTVTEATGEAVTIDVAANPQPVIDAVNGFVRAYNSLRDNLETVTDFDAENETTGILFGRSEAVRVDSELSRLLTDRYAVGGSINSLQQIGVSVDENGRLSLDESRLTDALEESPGDVEALFQDEERGVLARLDATIDSLAGDDSSLLSSRSETLSRTIDSNELRLADLDERLERQRERLLLDFIRLEEAIASLQNNLSSLDSIQPISLPNS